jgi:membrane protein DedA with SNARE-associated domain
MIENALHWLIEFIHALGYPGVFIMTFLESTFVPLPSETTMIPLGYLVQQGRMEMAPVLFLSVAGTLIGSLFNYWIARSLGRWALIRYGRYFLINEEKLHWLENYFESHGPISIFTGRLILGVRHVISFPAGLSKMDLKKFCLYTTLGGGLWMSILVALGYFIGENQELMHQYLHWIIGGLMAFLVILIAFYMYSKRKKA